MQPSPAERTASAGLRARKKLRTRDALCHAALDLFGSRGFDGTTLDDIAAAADVSKRTLLRYFTGKEDVLLAVFRELAVLTLRELDRRPPEEPPLAALREATRRALTEVTRAGPEYRSTPACLAVLHLVAVTPGLLVSLHRVLLSEQDALAGILAAREHLADPADPRPQLLVSMHACAMTVAVRTWQASGSRDLDTLLHLIDLCLDNLSSAAGGPWAGSPVDRGLAGV
ncbi:TetR/AcrR family transcriptional regulator [Streptomyces sp. NPDC090052]|uniref:TetR/AcrR family transcriptional regulator n=1 Tax=unclassified Streptomyces TaxID=2593676 RepID=UPI002E1D7B2C|nr:TetR family transcriptional regulator [Streptomyces sp. NBC_01020]WSX43562.1 TetR family transcriptional regulator [Streptomyces sp. NBC_00963]WSX68409.1 TetR family transcriptional regulator [Streptomyces sp. NBC_00932]